MGVSGCKTSRLPLVETRYVFWHNNIISDFALHMWCSTQDHATELILAAWARCTCRHWAEARIQGQGLGGEFGKKPLHSARLARGSEQGRTQETYGRTLDVDWVFANDPGHWANYFYDWEQYLLDVRGSKSKDSGWIVSRQIDRSKAGLAESAHGFDTC